jgi:hypothetical protein
MKLYNRVAVFALLLISAITITSCGNRQERRGEAWNRHVEDMVKGFRDGFYDSTVVVKINDSVASDADARMVAKTIEMSVAGEDSDSSAVASVGRGATTIVVNLPEDDTAFSGLVPSFVGPVAIVGTIMVFGMPVVAVLIICYFIYRTKSARYRAISDIVASGREMPKGMFPAVNPRAKFDSGIRYVAWGVGIGLFFFALGTRLALLMLVPIIIGGGKLASYWHEQRRPSGDDTPSDGSIPPDDAPSVSSTNGDSTAADNTNIPPIPNRD